MINIKMEDGKVWLSTPVNQSGIQIGNNALVHDLHRVENHSADPIKKEEDIARITDYLVANGRYRDNVLFWMGISFGVRCGDLLNFRFGHLIDEHGRWIDEIRFVEQKTKETRSVGKNRVVYLTDPVKNAIELYCSGRAINRDDFVFPSYKNGKAGNHMSRQAVDKIFKHLINDELGMPYHASTHMFRKTFAYHVLTKCEDRSRALEYLQLIFGHSSPMITLMYAGVTDEEIRDLTTNLYNGVDRYQFRKAIGDLKIS